MTGFMGITLGIGTGERHIGDCAADCTAGTMISIDVHSIAICG